MSATLKAENKHAKKLAYATRQTAPLAPGRRAFFQYRDLGVTEGSNGAMRAQITSVIRGKVHRSVANPWAVGPRRSARSIRASCR